MAAWNAGGGRPRQIGFARPLAAPLEVVLAAATTAGDGGELAGGRWVRTAGGELAWAARVRVEGARRLRLRLLLPELARGLRLWVRGGGEEPLSVDLGGRAGGGELWTPSVVGEEVFLAVVLPAGGAPLRLTVDAVLELYPRGEHDAAAAAPACLVDAACIDADEFPALGTATRAVAYLELVAAGALTPRAFGCTGTLLNDRDESTTHPYLLTAHHCLSTATAAASLEAFFALRRPSCGAPAPALEELPRVHGATLLVADQATDSTLVELSALPPDRVLLGWTTAPLAQRTALHRLSHPVSSAEPLPQSYTRGWLDVRFPACFQAPRPEFLYSRLERGGTLGGSSGSAAMLADGTVVGQLLGTCGGGGNPCDARDGEVDGSLAAAFPRLAPFLDAAPAGPCQPGPATLCLDHQPGDRRFQVEVDFATAQGGRRVGAAAAVPLAALGMPAAGLFTFFSDDNPELLIKLIDGCELNDRFWVFAGATTNAGVTLRVTDTLSGARRVYTSADLTFTPSVLDAGAFRCGAAPSR
jgi:hypothetical protein